MSEMPEPADIAYQGFVEPCLRPLPSVGPSRAELRRLTPEDLEAWRVRAQAEITKFTAAALEHELTPNLSKHGRRSVRAKQRSFKRMATAWRRFLREVKAQQEREHKWQARLIRARAERRRPANPEPRPTPEVRRNQLLARVNTGLVKTRYVTALALLREERRRAHPDVALMTDLNAVIDALRPRVKGARNRAKAI